MDRETWRLKYYLRWPITEKEKSTEPVWFESKEQHVAGANIVGDDTTTCYHIFAVLWHKITCRSQNGKLIFFQIYPSTLCVLHATLEAEEKTVSKLELQKSHKSKCDEEIPSDHLIPNVCNQSYHKALSSCQIHTPVTLEKEQLSHFMTHFTHWARDTYTNTHIHKTNTTATHIDRHKDTHWRSRC